MEKEISMTSNNEQRCVDAISNIDRNIEKMACLQWKHIEEKIDRLQRMLEAAKQNPEDEKILNHMLGRARYEAARLRKLAASMACLDKETAP
jgi:hypothetical protein